MILFNDLLILILNFCDRKTKYVFSLCSKNSQQLYFSILLTYDNFSYEINMSVNDDNIDLFKYLLENKKGNYFDIESILKNNPPKKISKYIYLNHKDRIKDELYFRRILSKNEDLFYDMLNWKSRTFSLILTCYYLKMKEWLKITIENTEIIYREEYIEISKTYNRKLINMIRNKLDPKITPENIIKEDDLELYRNNHFNLLDYFECFIYSNAMDIAHFVYGDYGADSNLIIKLIEEKNIVIENINKQILYKLFKGRGKNTNYLIKCLLQSFKIKYELDCLKLIEKKYIKHGFEIDDENCDDFFYFLCRTGNESVIDNFIFYNRNKLHNIDYNIEDLIKTCCEFNNIYLFKSLLNIDEIKDYVFDKMM